MIKLTDFNSPTAIEWTTQRREHWDKIASGAYRSPFRKFYRDFLSRKYAFHIAPHSRVLELGCGCGDLLAFLQPRVGVGIDFSPAMIEQAKNKHPHLTFIEADAHCLSPLRAIIDAPFDAIILSDLVNDIWDLRTIFEQIKPFCAPTTRIICNFYSHLYEYPFALAEKCNLLTPRLLQNWFTPADVENLAELTGFELVKKSAEFSYPFATPLVSTFFNRYLSRLFPFNIFNLTNFMVFRSLPSRSESSVSIIIPARNEAGNIEAALQRTPEMGTHTEIIFVEGNSTDDTWEVMQAMAEKYRHRPIKILRQTGKGKGDAVRVGFVAAENEILMILDADLTMPPESLPQFYEALVSGKAEFVNGVRLVYPQEKAAMRFCNLVANKFFGLAFSWLLNTSIKDTLCGTKVMSRAAYAKLAENRAYFGDFDPFGDFDLLFGAAKLDLKIRDLPVRYRERIYGTTNISRWRDGWVLLKMVMFALRKIKFI